MKFTNQDPSISHQQQPQQQPQPGDGEEADPLVKNRKIVTGVSSPSIPVQVVRPQPSSKSQDNNSNDDDKTSSDGDAASTAGPGTAGTSSSSVRKRRERNPIPDSKKDEKYWRRRMKNNLAAKRSRETKREKENQLTMRAAFLEKEHWRLRQVILIPLIHNVCQKNYIFLIGARSRPQRSRTGS